MCSVKVSSQEIVLSQPTHAFYKPMTKAPCAFASHFLASHILLIDRATGGENQQLTTELETADVMRTLSLWCEKLGVNVT
jgi:hypothetical protein